MSTEYTHCSFCAHPDEHEHGCPNLAQARPWSPEAPTSQSGRRRKRAKTRAGRQPRSVGVTT